MPSLLQPWLSDLVVAGGVAVLLLLSRLEALRHRVADVVLWISAGSATAAVLSMNAPRTALAGGAIVADPWSTFLRFVLSMVAMAVAWLATRSGAHEERAAAMPWAFFVASLLGAHLAVSAAHAGAVVAGFELCWLGAALWIAGRDRSAAAAATAMLLEGAAATGVMVLGTVLLFGLGGELGWRALRDGLAAAIGAPGARAAIFSGVALVFAGAAARAALVPWHVPRADVVARVPLPVGVWVQLGLPIAALGMFARFVRSALVADVEDGRWQSLPGIEWASLVTLFAIATVAVGHVAALRERDVKRMLAWLATAQVGYLVVGLAAQGEDALAALLFHAVPVATMTAGAMAAVAPVVEAGSGQDLEVLRGLARRGGSARLLAACLVVFVLSFAAVLPTAGYEGRARLLAALIGSGGQAAALVLSAASLVGLLACTRVLVTLFDRPPAEAGPVAADFEAALLALLLAAATLAIGLAPAPLASLAERGTAMLAGAAGP